MNGKDSEKKRGKYLWSVFFCALLLFTACAKRDMRGWWQFRQIVGETVTEMQLYFQGGYTSGSIISTDGTIGGEYVFSFNHDLTFTIYWPSSRQGWFDKAVYYGGFAGKDEMSGRLDYYVAFSDGQVFNGTWSAYRLDE